MDTNCAILYHYFYKLFQLYLFVTLYLLNDQSDLQVLYLVVIARTSALKRHIERRNRTFGSGIIRYRRYYDR